VVRRKGRIVVAAGTNGAGKSSLVGEFLAGQDSAYFNPDLFARRLIDQGWDVAEANAHAWKTGVNGLRRAIARNDDFSFETTLGGSTLAQLLHSALEAGRDVIILYVGLSSPELHIARVRERVRRGGHDIPEGDIRRRYTASLANLVSFLGKATEVHVFDNSAESPEGLPQSRLVFRMRGRKLVEPAVEVLLENPPDWAKPIIAAAIRMQPARKVPRRKK
jgi:predicted ABC-type ATPase